MINCWFFKQKALKEFKNSYISSLSKSLCLSLDEFYQNARFVFVSSLSGEGFEELFSKAGELRQEYYDTYHRDLLVKVKELDLKEEK